MHQSTWKDTYHHSIFSIPFHYRGFSIKSLNTNTLGFTTGISRNLAYSVMKKDIISTYFSGLTNRKWSYAKEISQYFDYKSSKYHD